LYFNGRRISDLQISGAGNTIGFRVDVRAAGGNWLGVVCPPRTAPGDARLLGLPFVSVLATLDDG
jgi:hypothetical protein